MTAIDPVCGMPVDERSAPSLVHAGERLWFCSEFCKEHFATGWSIGGAEPDDDDADTRDLHDKLEGRILPLYYDQRGGWIQVMQQSIALGASFFNTHRMVLQYLAHAYAVARAGGALSGGSNGAPRPAGG